MFYADEGPNPQLFAKSHSLRAIRRADTVLFALHMPKSIWWGSVTPTVPTRVTTYGYRAAPSLDVLRVRRLRARLVRVRRVRSNAGLSARSSAIQSFPPAP